MNLLRSRPRTSAGLQLLVVLGLLTPVAASCSPTSAGADSADPRREIRDLITALTPPPATSIPVVKSEHFGNRKRTLERLRGSSEAHGLEALRVYREEPPDLPEVRAGLLDIAAHTAPKAAEELLVELTVTFGEHLLVRREAAELLGECVPARAVLVLEPILRERYDDRTYPPEDQLLQAWITASDKLERDTTSLLALVATDMQRPMDVRHLATKALGPHSAPKSRGGKPSAQGVQALESLLVESSGNGYIRRLALQSLGECLSDEDFCPLAKRIQDREADPEFIMFIQSALDKRCPLK